MEANDSCRKGLDLSIPTHKSGSLLGLVESDTGRGVFFTKLTGRLLLEVAVNKTQAAQYRDSRLLPEAWPETLNHAAAQGHP